MSEESPTSGIGPDKLRNLLQICAEAGSASDEVDSDKTKAELLQDLLSQSVPVEALLGNLSEHLTTLCRISGIESERSVRDLLTCRETDVRLLKIIRDHFKRKSKCTNPDLRKVATAVYYAAIAYALVMHDLKITKFSNKDLSEAFSRLSDAEWIPRVLADLFGEASIYCQHRSSG